MNAGNFSQADCIILGGGASGLCAAAELGRQGMRVLLLERGARVGKKLLATGNGRCNLSNIRMEASFYGESADFVRRVYEQTPPDAVMAFFSSLGLMTVAEEGRLYPRTLAASSVLDVLRRGCAAVSLITGCDVTGLSPSRRGGWLVQTKEGPGFCAPRVLMAMGGCAAPGMDTDGAGARLLEWLGHRITPLYPALVQLRCDHPALRSLKGIRVRAALTLLIGGAAAAQEQGELLFTDYGVSGVCVFQLSRYVSPALSQGREVRLLVNLLAEIRDVEGWLSFRMEAFSSETALALFTGVFPRLLSQALLRQAGIAADAPVSSLSRAQRQTLGLAIRAFPLPVIGTQGFAHAQVTRGGVAVEETDPRTMASRLYDGLYLAGEVLDVDGPCGGYNLHFAFASALTAARAISSSRASSGS